MKIKTLLSIVLLLIIGTTSFSQEKNTDGRISVSVNGKDVEGMLMRSSTILPYSPDILSSYGFAAAKENIKNGQSAGSIGNLSVKRIFQVLYGKDFIKIGEVYFDASDIPQSRISFKNVDTTKLVYVLNGKRENTNLYSIQFISKKDLTVEQIKAEMIKDMETCFDLKTSWVKQQKKCIVVSRGKTPITEYKDGLIEIRWGSNLIATNGVPMAQFLARMANDRQFVNTDYPIVDETNFKGKLGKIDFPISDTVIDYAFLKRELPKYGLELSIQERTVNVLEISAVSK